MLLLWRLAAEQPWYNGFARETGVKLLLQKCAGMTASDPAHPTIPLWCGF